MTNLMSSCKPVPNTIYMYVVTASHGFENEPLTLGICLLLFPIQVLNLFALVSVIYSLCYTAVSVDRTEKCDL